MLLEKIREEVAAGRVSEQTHPAYPHLSIFKYSDSCNFEDGWNEINRICRGLIVDTQSGKIVARSFPKFFNIGERPESSLENLPNEPFEVFEKKDGSMGSIYKLPTGKWAVATPGSMDSPQARKATEMLAKYDLTHVPPNVTLVTEIIYPENQIVINYGNRQELVLLAIFNMDGSEWSRNAVDTVADEMGCPRPICYHFKDLTKLFFGQNEEGYVIRFASGLRVKAKSPIYVQAHRFLTNISIPRVVEGCRDGSIAAVAAAVPETWRSKLDDLMAMVKTRFEKIKSEITVYHVRLNAIVPQTAHPDPKEWRKASALWIQSAVPKEYQAGVFQLLSNKDPSEFIWKITEEELINESKMDKIPTEN